MYAALNPKTIAFNAAGVVTILGASLAVEAEWAALVAFVLLASLSVTAPVALSVFAPRRSAEVLALAERWLGDNSAVVAVAVLLVLGLMVLYSGAEGLAQIYRPA
jgi:threonine/homoserine/homoserine lactone efflux protein